MTYDRRGGHGVNNSNMVKSDQKAKIATGRSPALGFVQLVAVPALAIAIGTFIGFSVGVLIWAVIYAAWT
jgi:hypothetical protein